MILAQFFVSVNDNNRADHGCQQIGDGHGIQHAVQSEKNRKQKREAHAENELTHHGQHGRRRRFSHRLQKDKRRLVHTGKNHHAQIRTERFDREIGIIGAFVRGAENPDQRMREAFHDQQRDGADGGFTNQQQRKKPAHPVGPLCAHIEPYDGDTARRHADDDRDHDLKEFHHDPDDRHRDLRVLLHTENGIQRAVFADHVVDGRHRRDERDLRKKAAKPERNDPADHLAFQYEGTLIKRYALQPEQIPYGKRGGNDLPDHSRNGGAGHTPFENENEYGIKDHIQHRAEQRRRHSEPRAAVRADHRIHRLSEHIERKTERDPEEILFGQLIGFLIDARTEHRDNAVGEDQIYGGQHCADDHGDQDRVAESAARFIRTSFPQQRAYHGAATVADTHGNGQRDHRQREDDSIGRVAVRAEIICVCNEYLIDDIVQRADKQRDDTGDCVFAHQFAELFLGKRKLCLFHQVPPATK